MHKNLRNLPTETTPNDRLTVLILAGGGSTRMGTDKALLPWQGIPMLQRVYRIAQQCCTQVKILTPWFERYQPLLPDATFQAEQQGGQGPLVALAEGLAQISTPWILLLACDLPQLEYAVLQQWIDQLPDGETNILACIPHYNDRWEPLCGFYAAQALPQLQAFIAQGGRSFQQWLTTIPVIPLPLDDANAPMLRNCNTLADWMEKTMEPTFFQFEQDFIQSMRCIPMVVRYNLDTCGIKLKLEQWLKFSESDRQVLATMPCETTADITAYRQWLTNKIWQATQTPAKDLPIDEHPPWLESHQIPDILTEKVQEEGVSLLLEQWQQLSPLQRFALIKLSRPSHENKNFLPALREFQLL